MAMNAKQRERKITNVTLAGSVVNLILTAGKLVAGTLGHSAAMVADGVHSLSDFISDIVILVFVKITAKEKDKSHDYGHGKFETMASIIVSLVLLIVAVKLITSGIESIMVVVKGGTLPQPGRIALWAAIISIVAKEALYQYTYRVGKKVESTAVMANAWHHRSDALSSVGAFLGIGGAILLGDKWVILDPIVCAAIGITIVVIAVKMSIEPLKELLEVSLPDEVEDEIIAISNRVKGVDGTHNLQTRRIGRSIIIDEHLVVDSQLKVIEAHDIATSVEKALTERFGPQTQIHIHIEPEEDAD